MTEKDSGRNGKKIGLALVTTPIAIVGSVIGQDAAIAEQVNSAQNDDAQNDNAPNGSGTSTATSSSAASVTSIKTVQLSRYTVKAGDSISKIARANGLSTNQLLKINKLTAKSIIMPGQSLKLVVDAQEPSVGKKLDQAKKHVVAAGETLASIAAEHEVSLSVLLAMNQLQPSALLFPGQELIIGSLVPSVAPAAKVANSVSHHKVVEGETLSSISRRYGVSIQSLLSNNKLNKKSLIYIGQTLKIAAASNEPPESSVDTPATQSKRPSSVCMFHGFHKIKSGETISRIASLYGVSTQSLLSANNLGWTTTIFIGQKLIIPDVHDAAACPKLTPLTDEMRENAEVIVSVGKSLGISDFGIVIALATAMQESSLRNVPFGDRNSVGLFQQRPSAAWGTKQQIMDANYAARAFFGGRGGPAKGLAKGLLDIDDWESMTLTEAAQAVQISAHPSAYAKWEPSAWVWLDIISGKNNSQGA